MRHLPLLCLVAACSAKATAPEPPAAAIALRAESLFPQLGRLEVEHPAETASPR